MSDKMQHRRPPSYAAEPGFDPPTIHDEPIPPPGGIAVFTPKIRGRTLTVINTNDGGLEIEFRIDPRHAFEVAGKLIVSAIKATAHDFIRRNRRGPING